MVIDSISTAARNVSILLKRDLSHPPIPIHSVKKQGDNNVAPKTNMTFDFQEPQSTIEVFEVWKVYLEDNEEELDNVFVVISGDFDVEGYRNGEWSNIEYRGFYTTEQEAINEINGFLR